MRSDGTRARKMCPPGRQTSQRDEKHRGTDKTLQVGSRGRNLRCNLPGGDDRNTGAWGKRRLTGVI